MSYLPFLLMALDIADTTGETGLDIMLFWEILLATQVLCVWVIFPILIVYYESNENDGAVRLLVIFNCFLEEENQKVFVGRYANVPHFRFNNRAYLFLAQ